MSGRWPQFLRGHRPREDRDEPLLDAPLEPDRPALLQSPDVLTAAWIALRVLQAIAQRGGTLAKAPALDALERALGAALPAPSRHLADEEVRRILTWLEGGLQAEPDPDAPAHPELVIMREQVEARALIIRFAIDAGLDVELEHYDPARDRWPRRRGHPLALFEAQDEPALRLQDLSGVNHELALHLIRWIMPVHPKPLPKPTSPQPPQNVLAFPKRKRK